ncbi:MAG: phosphoenolpyruvate synthase [Candidatus Woesearchaeota archaeon]
MKKEKEFILWFDQVDNDDVSLVGGKNASLGEMYQNLTSEGINVPNGFALTSYAYRYFLDKTGLKKEIKDILANLDTNNLDNLKEKGWKVRHAILDKELPHELKVDIKNAYHHLGLQYHKNPDVAVRSSATAEDLPDASFAGQQETYLNIKGPAHLIESVKKCIASLFTDRAISYREDKGFDHFNIALSVGVQKMVRSDKASSGVMFSIDTESGFKNAVFITSAYGLGENVVQGAVNPDEFYVFKPTLKEGKRPILYRNLGSKEIKMIYNKGVKPVKNVKVAYEDRRRYSISDDEIIKLAKWATRIEEHYSEKRNKLTPMDMEWAKDGETEELFIVQARPETVQSQKDFNVYEEYNLKEKGEVLLEGAAVGEKIGTGKVNVIKNAHEINEFNKGDVLVTDMTDPDWEPIMKIASAIVTNRGGRTCHAAIISREMGIPCVVGTEKGTKVLNTGQDVTVSCSEGEAGRVYEGILDYDTNTINLGKIPETNTKIMMNIANPEQAFKLSFLPNDGVGLAREEFIINSYIKIHPKALLNFDSLEDEKLKKKIDDITSAYDDKRKFYVDKLAEGISTLAGAFYPKPVILRFSDFKTNEYANLIGGDQFEPEEDNPMIGWRGASRYYSDDFKESFGLECEAVKKVRNEMGLTNLKLMIPFCRTIEEADKVLEIMGTYGLKRGHNGLQVYVMAEIPSNVVLADQFSERFDGFSIGSNDLTQLTLGVDRDSELVSHVYDERNSAVKEMVSTLIEKAGNHGRKVGICGQAPSDYPEFAKFLVENGIDSISLNPDTVIKTRIDIYEKEKELGQHN